MTKTTIGAAMVAPKPSLWWTESKLGEGLAALQMKDPDGLMTEEQAREMVARYISPDAVVERREEFADFLREGDELVELKKRRAQALAVEAKQIEAALEDMRAQAVSVMKALGVKALAAGTYTLKLKDSLGSVIVDDPEQVPAEFWRIAMDNDLLVIRKLVELVEGQARKSAEGEGFTEDALRVQVDMDEFVMSARWLLEEAEKPRRAVDKMMIKAEWKANGETRDEVDPETGEIKPAPMVPGVHKEVTTKLVVA